MILVLTNCKKDGESMVLDVAKIRLAVARKQMSICEVRKLAHISSVTERRINAGCEVQPKTAGKLAAALGVDVAELLKE